MRMRIVDGVALALALAGSAAPAQQFPPEQVKRGAEIYEPNCSTCHGPRLKNPEWAVDLRAFPRDQKMRFVDSVTHGKNAMPPWGDILKPDDIDALWAYLLTGEKN